MDHSPSKRGIRQRLLDYFRIEDGELEPVLWLSAYLMLGMATVVCLKAVSDSVFLSVFDARRLPLVDLAITVLVGLVVGVYLRMSNRFPLSRLILFTQLFLTVNLFVFWLMLGRGFRGLPVLIYIWVGLFAVLIPSQVWSLSGIIFDTRQAKRLFSLVGSGGILGAALGGNFAGFIGPTVGTEYILLATVGFVLACAGIVSRLARLAQAPTASGAAPDGQASMVETLRLVLGTRYLRLITFAIFASAVASTLVKYQFKAIVQIDLGTDRDVLTSFYGYFYGYVAVFSFFLHTLLTSRLLRWIGLGSCLVILPLALLGGTVTLMFSASLVGAILARTCDQAFRHSIDRASIELLYIPIPAAIRGRVKSFLDIVVSRMADALASIILLLVITVLHAQTQQISWAGVAFILPWLFVVWLLRGEYVKTLRSTIERKDIRAETLLSNLAEAAPVRQLETTLQSSDQRSIEAAIDWMQFSGATAAQVHLATLLRHESSVIRRKAMGVVAANHIPGCESEVLGFLEIEEDVRARWQALGYLEQQNVNLALAALEKYLGSPDWRLAATAAAWILRNGRGDRGAARRVFFEHLESAVRADVSSRASAARLIGLAPATEETAAYLSRFLRDPEIQVVRAALESAAEVQPWEETPVLLNMLRDRRSRLHARRALAAFGDPILSRLGELAGDRDFDLVVRRQLPRVMSVIGGQRAADLLVTHLKESDYELSYNALRALSRIRRLQPAVRFDREAISRLLVGKLRDYYQEVVWLDGIPANGDGAGSRFLRRALKERLGRKTDETFQLLALIYPRREMLDAHHWIASGRVDLRSNALEFLDSRLDNPVREMLLPVVEDRDGQRVLQAGRELFGLRSLPYSSVLRSLLHLSDTWLQACASYVAAEDGMVDLRQRVSELAGHADPVLREAAAAAQRRLTQGYPATGP